MEALPESSIQNPTFLHRFQHIHYPLPDTFFHERTGNRATNAEIARLIRKIACGIIIG